MAQISGGETRQDLLTRISYGVIGLVVLVLIGAGFAALNQHYLNQANQPTTAATVTQTISYAGRSGVDALTLLKEHNKVEVKTSDFGAYVTSINGITPDSNHFWAFYINGKPAAEAANKYVTKSTDKINWKLESISQN